MNNNDDPIYVRPSQYVTALANALEPYYVERGEDVPSEEALEDEGWGKTLRQRLAGVSGELFGSVVQDVANEYIAAKEAKETVAAAPLVPSNKVAD